MTLRVTLLRCLRIFVPIALAGDVQGRTAGADPSDVTQSSYATPVRGDVIQWSALRNSPWEVVPFEDASAIVRPSTRAALLAAVARQGSGWRIEVIGRTDPTGKPALGLARALAIKRILMAAGVSSDRILVVTDDAAGERWEPSRQMESTIRWLPLAPGAGAAAPTSATAATGTSTPTPAVDATLSAATTTPAPAAAARPTWEVLPQDITLARTLERWAASAGYRLRWDADRNFLIAASDRYEGGFEEALRAVLGSAGIRQSDYPLEACIYANLPPLVRVTRLGEQARECDKP